MHLRRIRREGTTTSLQEPIEAGDGGLTVADVLPDDFVMEEHCEQTDAAAGCGRWWRRCPPATASCWRCAMAWTAAPR